MFMIVHQWIFQAGGSGCFFWKGGTQNLCSGFSLRKRPSRKILKAKQNRHIRRLKLRGFRKLKFQFFLDKRGDDDVIISVRFLVVPDWQPKVSRLRVTSPTHKKRTRFETVDLNKHQFNNNRSSSPNDSRGSDLQMVSQNNQDTKLPQPCRDYFFCGAKRRIWPTTRCSIQLHFPFSLLLTAKHLQGEEPPAGCCKPGGSAPNPRRFAAIMVTLQLLRSLRLGPM